ncbi:MAG: hypothetical protein GF401_08665 [Chitinivibrionales bacterium]|nr:hypothetical protein [Chitinivibrionales bacterium]
MFIFNRQMIYLFVMVVAINSASRGQSVFLAADGAAAKSLGEGIDNLQIGFSFTTDGVYALFDFLHIGLRYSYTDWAPSMDEMLPELDDSLYILDIEGTIWSMEIAPLVRLTTLFEKNVINLFVQTGAGLYVIHSETTANAINLRGEHILRELGEGTGTHFGVSVGGGVTIGHATPVMLRLYPQWNYVARDDQPNNYWNFNGGLVFGLGR